METITLVNLVDVEIPPLQNTINDLIKRIDTLEKRVNRNEELFGNWLEPKTPFNPNVKHVKWE